MKIILLFFFIVNLTSCAQNRRQESEIVTGRYNNISVIVNGDSIQGVYQYYKDWNQELKDFESKNNFYFFGTKKTNNKFDLTIVNPGESENFGDASEGELYFRNDTLIYFQNALEGMYQPAFFVKNNTSEFTGYRTTLTDKKTWKELRFIKSSRANLFELPKKNKKSTFLTKYDVAWVVTKKEGWCFIEFYKFDSNILLAKGWVKETDMYSSNPDNW